MSGKRQKSQMELAFTAERRGEAPETPGEGTEPLMAKRGTESPASTERLMEEVLEAENLREALKRVKANKGSPGIDGMTVERLPGYLKEHWAAHRDQLLSGTYKPQALKRVEIPKPGGGKRKLSIPTVLDRFIQQAVMQVLQERWDRTFSESSFGFRPGRSAHQAVTAAQRIIEEGHGYVVEIDLEKFFDRVNHDVLMGRVAKRVGDKRLLKLLRAFLNAGMIENGLESPSVEGTPQGGPLSPLLSNLLLDELDKELERRGHRFVRYADDCNIYVRSERAGMRVMGSVKAFLAKKLKLKVNEEKSAVGKAGKRKFLAFRFGGGKLLKRTIAPEALARFKRRIGELTRRTRGVSLEKMVRDLAPYLTGWRNYFGFCQTPSVLEGLDSWIRRRLRCAVWKGWKRGKTRFAQLRKRGIGKDLAAQTAGSPHGPWHLSRSPALSFALPNVYFNSLGLPSLALRRTP
jgi:RNA-directed DNA polymerase